MGGRSSKTKPARSPGKSKSQNQNQDTTVVETFGVDMVDEVQTGEVRAHSMDALKSHAPEDRGAASSGSVVHGIWEGRADNNLAPLSSEYGKATKPIELQVSSSEDEDEEDTSNHGKKRTKARKKKKPKPATEKSARKLSVLKPVKPPPAAHTMSHQNSATTASQAENLHDDDAVRAISVETGSSEAASKPDSPSRFFGFDGWKARMSSTRSISSTREREKSTREKERSSGSPEKAVAANPVSKTGTASLERFMEWREGTFRSSGRESSTHMSEVSGDEASAVKRDDGNEVEDFDALERETASALAPTAAPVVHMPRKSFMQNQSEQLKANEKRAAVPSPAASVKSQRSMRSTGRNLNIDDFDENIMNDILAETID